MYSTFSIVSMVRKPKAGCYPSSIRHHRYRWWTYLGMVCLLAGCAAAVTPVAPQAAETPPAIAAPIFALQGTAQAAVTALILAERQAAIDQDLALLGQLWDADARIVDGRNSVTARDDYIWQGRAAVLDRYHVAVFPFVLPPLGALDAGASIVIVGDVATVRHGVDTWQLRKAEQRWWLTELRYQVPTSQ